MIRHLKTKHHLDRLETEEGSNSQSQTSTSLSSWVVPSADVEDRKMELDMAVADLVVKDLQPFSIVEDKGFQAYTRMLNPKYSLPTRKTLKRLVENMYEETKWQSYTLQTEKVSRSYTGATLANTLKRIFREWNIESKVKYVITDSSPNMLAAIQDFGSDVTSISCFAHTLNLVVNSSLTEFEPLINIRQKCRDVVSHFKSSCLASDKLTEIQSALGIEKHKLILEVETRWNSTYEMFERLLQQKHAVTAALSYFDVPFELLTASEWDIMAYCLPVLKPLFLLTKELSSETHVSISKVLVCINQLNVFLNSSEHELATKLREMMNKYFRDIELNSIYSMSNMLDPRFKTLGFMTIEGAENAKKLIFESSKVTTETDDKSFITDYNIEMSTSFWANFDTRVSAYNCSHTEQFGPAAELDSYMKEPCAHRQSNPLEYWKLNATKYPHLSQLAQKVLCCPATSVPSERMFSKAGNMLSKKRNKLKDSTLNKMLLLNSG
ncbi:PREDICTED: zinc finger BED domain-containing protein 4-like [Dufourea novaeangliae]|uniref:zinc finger BED domain-containing protein 4-like n=1 Tax=Dufourea novaeangliae TaxID=178035 RepID=UPI00076700A3|nr:PREDICTED: zinc finger BED domain-containing protein 4-like [Dufourea novaeangliae]